MKAVVQRVTSASVEVDGQTIGAIKRGFLVLVGVAQDDTGDDVRYTAEKCAKLRIFEDAAGKMNLALADVSGAMLIISQFTLLGDVTSGRRPFFGGAARPETAIPLYEMFIDEVKKQGVTTASGKFGADMKVSLCNDGPVTIIIDSTERK
ncbi:MAG: D-aminoacyl-tRNA deacylase [Victivallaceae bacterium]|nr:D-aminoacyl-tRNA deacylase [Victivallaceae bacterium]